MRRGEIKPCRGLVGNEKFWFPNERARHKDLKISFDCPPAIGWIAADERRLKQVVFNLLSNAVTYTPSRGNISLKAGRQKDDIVVSISDTGVGIPSEVRDRLFQAFEKGDRGSAVENGEADDSGVGLGLTIVKSFVELHDGEVEVKSQPGRGTTVSIRVPVGHLGGTEDADTVRDLPADVLPFEGSED